MQWVILKAVLRRLPRGPITERALEGVSNLYRGLAPNGIREEWPARTLISIYNLDLISSRKPKIRDTTMKKWRRLAMLWQRHSRVKHYTAKPSHQHHLRGLENAAQ